MTTDWSECATWSALRERMAQALDENMCRDTPWRFSDGLEPGTAVLAKICRRGALTMVWDYGETSYGANYDGVTSVEMRAYLEGMVERSLWPCLLQSLIRSDQVVVVEITPTGNIRHGSTHVWADVLGAEGKIGLDRGRAPGQKWTQSTVLRPDDTRAEEDSHFPASLKEWIDQNCVRFVAVQCQWGPNDLFEWILSGLPELPN